MCGLQSNGMCGLQSDTSSNDSIEEISALTLNSVVWSGMRGLRASESRVRRMGGAEQYASRSNNNNNNNNSSSMFFC